MTLVPVYSVYAYRSGEEDGTHDLRRTRIPEWNLVDALKWALEHGCDNILVTLLDTPVNAEPTVVHHVCHDHGCPGGCD